MLKLPGELLFAASGNIQASNYWFPITYVDVHFSSSFWMPLVRIFTLQVQVMLLCLILFSLLRLDIIF